MTLLAAGVVAAWVLAAAWAFRDMSHRTDSVLARYLAATWVLVSTPALLPFSVAVLTLVRPHEGAGERRLSSLLDAVRERAALRPACFACGVVLDERWVRCPTCSSWVGQQCEQCERWAPADAEICPWCAFAPGDETAIEDFPAEAPTRVDVPRPADQPAADEEPRIAIDRPVRGPALGPVRGTVAAMADGGIHEGLPAAAPRSA
jgi:RNA polymerase subunit RPABC4/transcription elongation factor Spt4